MKRFLKKAMSAVLCGAMLSAALLSTQCLGLGYDNYTPTLIDTNDDGTATYLWQPGNSPAVAFTDEDGRGKVQAVTYKTKAATGEANILFDGFGEHMTGNINYISFDIKMATLMNMSFAPRTSGWAYPYSVYISKNGFIAALNFAPTQYSGTPKVIYDCASYDKFYSWGYRSCAPFEANTWYNIKFVFDRANGLVKIYLDDTLLGTQSSDVVADLTAMVIRNCSDITDTSSPHMYIDNFKIGTTTGYIDVKSASILSDGNASIKFSDPVDTETLTSDNVKILENGKSVSYTGTYDAATNTYICTLDSYKPFSYYTITVNNVKSETDLLCKAYSKTIAGADYNYTPTLIDTNDDGKATYLWQPGSAHEVAFTDEDGRGKAQAVTYKTKAATGEANILFDGFGEYMTGNINYLSFDIKMPTLMNMSFSPHTSGWAYPFSAFISEKGFIMASGYKPTQYTDDAKDIVYNYTYEKLTGWGFTGLARFEANTWYNIKFVFDRANGLVKIYLDDTLLGTQSSDVVADLTAMLIRNCADIKDESSPQMYIDNFRIGTAQDSMLKITDADGNAVTEFTSGQKLYIDAGIKNNTASDINVQAALAAYDANDCMIGITVHETTVSSGDSVSIAKEDMPELNLSGAKTVKAFLWSDWNTLKPFCGCVSASLKAN